MHSLMKVAGLVLVATLLHACTGGSVVPVAPARPAPLATSAPDNPAAAPDEATTPAASAQPKADVLFVRATEAEDGTWSFAVTVQHPDSGWENHADGWDVVTPDGAVVQPEGDSPFTRLLTHPHVEEQPFTRSRSGIVLPPGTNTVQVRAHSLVGGFGGQEVEVDLRRSQATATFEVVRVEPADTLQTAVAMTNQQADGNRLAAGQGRLPESTPLDIALDGRPVWLTAAPVTGGSVWVAVLDDGRVQAFRLTGQVATPIPMQPERLPPGAPPLLVVEADQPRLLTPPADATPFAPPALLSDGRVAYVADTGDLVLWDGAELARLAVAALPDARILVDEHDRLLLLTGPTDRYAHGILGDAVEAGSVTLIESTPVPRIVATITIPAPQVIEGIAPLWADLNGDGEWEIIVTTSDDAQGAQVLAFAEDGTLLAAGPAIGRGHRWRHQLAVAPFGPNGEVELAEVLTPHIGGVTQFYRLAGGALDVVSSTTGYTSHQIGSRNLDMAVAGDFDSDGAVELLLPNDAFRSLGAIRRTAEGAEVAWTLPMGGARVATNLAVVAEGDQIMEVGVGREDGVLRIWQTPQR